MTSDDIFLAIEEIAATPGKNDKIALLASNVTNDDFKRVLVAALDPLVSYGVKQLPIRSGAPAGDTFDLNTWMILTQLSARVLSGGAALATIEREFNRLSEDSAILLKRILLKDLRAGFGDSSVNKASKGLIRTFPYMRCCLPKDTKTDKFDWAKGVISQEKADGTFTNVDHDNSGFVRFTTRQGTQYPIIDGGMDQLERDVKLALTPGAQTHGEITVVQDDAVLPREIGNGIMNSLANGGTLEEGQALRFEAWDQIPLTSVEPKGKYEVTYARRLAGLVAQLTKANPHQNSVRLIPTKIVHSMDDAWVHFRELLAKNKEGTVFKNPTAIWRDGTSKDQVKLKLSFEVELVVVGFEPGNGKNESTFGSLICRSDDDLLEVSVSGLTDAKRQEIWDSSDEWIGKVITVRANSVMKPSSEDKPHSLFLPRFVEERNDKFAADTLQRILDQQQAAMESA